MLSKNLLDILTILDSSLQAIKTVKSDLDIAASLISNSLSEGMASDILVLMEGDEDAMEDILVDLEEELDQVRKEDLRDLLKQLRVMKNLVTSLGESLDTLDE